MAIFLRQSHNVKPPLWGSPADRQYAIWDNLEKIYGCDPKDEALIMPLFWGLPPLDYSGKNNHGTNYGADYVGDGLNFNTDLDNVVTSACDSLFSANGTIILGWKKVTSPSTYYYFFTAGALYIQISLNISKTGNLAFSVNDQVQVNDAVFVTPGNKTFAFMWNDSANVRKVYYQGVLHTTWTDAFASAFTNQTFNIGGRPDSAGRHAGGVISYFNSFNTILNPNQIALFHDNEYGLYQKVGRPIWSIPAVDAIAPTSTIYGSLVGPMGGPV